jgi:hypothetical protein
VVARSDSLMLIQVDAIATPLQILDQTCGENVLLSRLLCGLPWGACVLNAGRKPAEVVVQ